jgi:cysteine synthase B
MLGGALEVPVTPVVPGNASRERLDRIRAHGAELILTDPLEGYDHALCEARRLALAHPDRYWYCGQYSNPVSWRAHYHRIDQEILEQVRTLTGAPPDALVAGVGAGGTLTGTGRLLRETAPDLFVASVIPEPFPGIGGLKPLGAPGDVVPAILEQGLIDARIQVSIEPATAMCRRLA